MLCVGDGEAWGNVAVYLFITAAIFCALGQVIWINKGLAVFPAVKFVPAYSASLSLLGSTIGAVYFQEYLTRPMTTDQFWIGIM
jgi:hypothetical protein